MRILFLSNNFPNPFEPTKAVFNRMLVRAMARRSHDIVVVSPIPWTDEWKARRSGCPGLPRHRTTSVDGIEVHHPRFFFPPGLLRSRYGWFFWQSTRKTVCRLIDRHRPDAILAYWVHPDGDAAVRAARRAGIPVGVIVGGSDVLVITKEPDRRRKVVRVLSAVDAVITVNRHLKSVVEGFGVAPDRVHTWSQGIDPTFFFPGDRRAARRELGIAEEGAILLWVGRLVPVKSPQTLVEAAAQLSARGLPFRLYLVGDGPMRPALEARVGALDLSGTVRFVGPSQPRQIGAWYRAADLTLLPSLSEGLPNVLRESLACNTPFVASDVGGIAEIAGTANRLIRPGNATELADAIVASLANPSAASVERPRTWDESAEDLVRILVAVRDSRTAGAASPAQPLCSGRHGQTLTPRISL